MNLTVAIPPYREPISLEEMKNHLKIDSDITEDDELVAGLIVAARNMVEAGTGASRDRCKVMVATTFDYSMDTFCGMSIPLPRVPLISVTSITYVDTAGATQTLSASVYSVNTAAGCVDLAYNQSWPSTRYQPNAVTIRFVAGLVAPFTASDSTDVITPSGRSIAVGDRLRLFSSEALPGGLTIETDYFVIADSKLSLTSGGSAVNITTDGTGTHFFGLDLTSFHALRSVIRMLVSHWYQNREPILQTGAVPKALPLAVDAMLMNELA